MLELAQSPNRVGWVVAIGWFLVLVFVGQAARYLRWREDAERPQSHGAPVPGLAAADPPGRMALTLAAVVPLAVAPMMMLRPPGEVTVWLGGTTFLWVGLWLAVGTAQIVRDDRRVVDLTTAAEVIDLRDPERVRTDGDRVGAR